VVGSPRRDGCDRLGRLIVAYPAAQTDSMQIGQPDAALRRAADAWDVLR
jgi:hypothetical protein